MLARGFVLADVPARVTWRALLSYVRHPDPASAIYKQAAGPGSAWGTAEYLLAVLVDLAQVELWAKTKDGQSNRNRPTPVRRPGDGPSENETRFGDASMTLDETKAWLESRRAAAPMTIAEVVM